MESNVVKALSLLLVIYELVLTRGSFSRLSIFHSVPAQQAMQCCVLYQCSCQVHARDQRTKSSFLRRKTAESTKPAAHVKQSIHQANQPVDTEYRNLAPYLPCFIWYNLFITKCRRSLNTQF